MVYYAVHVCFIMLFRIFCMHFCPTVRTHLRWSEFSPALGYLLHCSSWCKAALKIDKKAIGGSSQCSGDLLCCSPTLFSRVANGKKENKANLCSAYLWLPMWPLPASVSCFELLIRWGLTTLEEHNRDIKPPFNMPFLCCSSCSQKGPTPTSEKHDDSGQYQN